jgi:tryptophanyl-tRNA synthetase
MKEKQRILTGDRPTGRLHIGHYLGSLKNRVKLQEDYDEYIIVANIQALTDNFKTPGKVRENIEELLCDYYACGIDFDKASIFIQSEVPQIHEIFIYLANFATVQQIQHNPTIKTELHQKGIEVSTPLGFFMYPIHQAADILCVNADLVPVGKDQAPMVEDTRILARKFNKTYRTDILHEPQALFGVDTNIPGIDGGEKMGKSLNNAIYLSDSEEELKKKVFKVYTDPARIHATDPGKIEGNVAFTYLDLFDKDTEEVTAMKERYQLGQIKDVDVKERLFEIMNEALTPIRNARLEAETHKKELMEHALDTSVEVSKIARGIADQMKEAMQLKFR